MQGVAAKNDASCDLSRACASVIHTGRLEGINNKIKVKRQAYGFRDDDYFILKIKGAFPGELQLNPR
jgi:hypothetical protein